MLLDLFFGKKDEGAADRLFADKVYTGSAAKMKACLALAKEQPGTLFIAWFSDTAWRYKNFFLQQGLQTACVTEARFVNAEQLQQQTPVFLEHYPLPATETALVADWDRKNMLVFSSMDEPLFKHFGSDKMIPLIKLLGMKESEAIEHPYVTESIIKGQNKIANKVTDEQSANSQAEWMERNLRDQ